MEVWDSPNSVGVVIDAVRCCKLALERRLGGPATYLMKSPPVQHSDERAADGRGVYRRAGGPGTPRRGAAPTSARGDDAGVGDVHEATVSPAGSLTRCT